MEVTTNIPALKAAQGIRSADQIIARSSQRLSTGLRVNSAADDPGSIGAANRLKTQAGSFSVVANNLAQGTASLKVVDDTLTQMTNILSDMQVAATQAAAADTSTTDGAATFAAYQAAIYTYADQLDSLANNAVWNETSLMNLTSSTDTLSIQSGITSSDTIDITLRKMTASQLSVNYSSTGTTIASTTAAATAASDISTALSTVASYQAEIGAYQNVMQAQGDLVANHITTYSQAYGNIMNADMAQEAANLAAAQIQRDSATAMLAQANNLNKPLVDYLLQSSLR